MVSNKGQSKVDQTKAEMVKLREAQAGRKAEVDALESELRRAVVAARTGKSAGAEKAQAEVDGVAASIAKLRTDDTFDSIAIEELSARLQSEEAALRREEWNERCENVRKLIQRRANWDKEQPEPLLAVVSKLKEKLLELQKLNAELVDALGKLRHPRLLEYCRKVSISSSRAAEIVSARLRPVVESPFSSQFLDVIAGADPGAAGYAERLLQVLDEIAEETAPDLSDLPTMQAVGLKP